MSHMSGLPVMPGLSVMSVSPVLSAIPEMPGVCRYGGCRPGIALRNGSVRNVRSPGGYPPPRWRDTSAGGRERRPRGPVTGGSPRRAPGPGGAGAAVCPCVGPAGPGVPVSPWPWPVGPVVGPVGARGRLSADRLVRRQCCGVGGCAATAVPVSARVSCAGDDLAGPCSVFSLVKGGVGCGDRGTGTVTNR